MIKFVMLIGPSGCGKSTYARKLSQNGYEVVASDAIRAELYDDESIQTNPSKVFNIVHCRVRDALMAGKNVVMDATNLSAKYRKAMLKYINKVDCHKIAAVVASSYEGCLARQELRERKVPEKVIYRQFCQFQMPQYNEGWNDIVAVYTDLFADKEHVGRAVLANYNEPHDNPHHRFDIGKHMDEVYRSIFKTAPMVVGSAARYHDIGKYYTKKFEDSHGNPCDIAHYYNHENFGAYISLLAGRGEEDPSTNEFIIRRAQLIALHMEYHKRGKKYEEFLASLNDDFLAKWLPKIGKADMLCA